MSRILHMKEIWILWVLFALVLQACGGAPGQNEAAEPTVAGETPAGGLPESGVDADAVLRVAMQPIVQTDPAFVSSDPEILIVNSIYDYLVDITPENTIEPRLATEWEISDDGLTYTFQLVENASFHDGSPFTAEDVVWTFDRLRDPELDLPTATLYENISGIEATGDYEVTFTLAEPNPFFLFDLSDNHALILDAGTEDPSAFNGTGPFQVLSYTPEDRLVTEANPNYFVEGEPQLSGVEFLFFNDQTAQVEALRGGQVDLVMVISTDQFISLQNEPSLEMLEVATNGFDLIRLRADREPGSDPRVRQALKLATDRRAIFDVVLQGYGVLGQDTPIGPLYETFYAEDLSAPERDADRARELLAEAGYPDGLDLTLHTPDTGNRPNLAVVLQDQWSTAGINLEVVVEPESVYYGENQWLEVDLGITGWGSRPYPQFYLEVMLLCEGQWNEAHYCNDELDDLIRRAGTTMDEQEQVQTYREIQQILIDDGPMIIPYFFSQLGAINNQFEGFEMNPFPGRSDLTGVRRTGD